MIAQLLSDANPDLCDSALVFLTTLKQSFKSREAEQFSFWITQPFLELEPISLDSGLPL